MPDSSFELDDINTIFPDQRTNQEWTPDIPHLKRFDDFTTIDWVNDNVQSHKQQLKNIQGRSRFFQISDLLGFLQNYTVLTVVGLIIGSIAASLNIITEYLSNLRTGYCSNAFYLNKSFCCWGELEESKCTQWVSYTNHSIPNYLIFIIISITLSFTASKLVLHYGPFAAGSGISEIKCIVSGFSFDKFSTLWTLIMKSIGLPLAIASGLSVGKEGPTVHYAVCVGSVISKMFALRYTKSQYSSSFTLRNILIASSAAGVAVAFGSPMGGVLFSIEEISNSFQLSTMWESYYCSLVAVATLQLINPFRTGQVVMFQVKFDQDWHFFEIPFYIILGLFGGVYGIVISKFNIKSVSFRKKYLGNYAIQEVLFLTAITSIISYFNEFLRLDMTEGMQILFEECNNLFENHQICDISSKSQISKTLLTLTLATLIRMVLIVFSYGCKVPAGIFVPSMACGAAFGRALGILAQLWREHNPNSSYFTSGCLADNKNCITPGTYAFLGAGAALSGITHLTVTVVVIMFELTGALKYIIPTMISVAVTKTINDRYGNGGIADQMIEVNGLPHIHPHETEDFHGHKAQHSMTRDIVSLPITGLSYKQINLILSKTDFQTFPIIQSENTPIIKGSISRDDLKTVINKYPQDLTPDIHCKFIDIDEIYPPDDELPILNFTEYINKAPLTAELDTPLELLLQIFHKLAPRSILIEERGELRGILTRKQILKYRYYLHNLEINPDELEREQTFTNHEFIWNKIKSIDDFIKDRYYSLISKISSRGRYRQL